MRALQWTIALAVGLAFSGGVWAADCVEVDIESPPEVYLNPDTITFVTLSGEVTNCGDTAAIIVMTATLTKDDTLEFRLPTPARIFLAAGETRSRTVNIPLPPFPPPLVERITGTYTACLTGTVRQPWEHPDPSQASDTDCTTTEILAPPGQGRKPPRKFDTR